MTLPNPSSATARFRSPEAREKLLQSYARMLARWPVPLDSLWVETRHGRAHVLVCGPSLAPPVLLLHGGGGNATTWIHNIEGLSRSLRVYAVDIIGDAGRSEGARPGSEAAYCAWLEDVLVGLDRPAMGLCGASFGAWLAAAYLRRSPDRGATRLAMLAPPNLGALRPGFLLHAVLATAFPSEPRVRRFQSRVSSPQAPAAPPWALDDLYVRWRSQRSSPPAPGRMTDEDLRALPAGALVVLGEDEALYDPRQAAARVRRLAPQARLELLDAAGHALAFDRADAVNRMLCEFFRGDQPAAEKRSRTPPGFGIDRPERAMRVLSKAGKGASAIRERARARERKNFNRR